MAVEKMQGISRLEQFVEELSEEERAKELKQEKKRQKRKNRRKNKCGFDMSEQEAEDKEKTLDEVILRQQFTFFKTFVSICSCTCLSLFTSGPFCMLQGCLESVDGSCKVCGSHDEEEEEAGCDESVAANSTSCSCPNTKQGKNTQITVISFSNSQVTSYKALPHTAS